MATTAAAPPNWSSRRSNHDRSGCDLVAPVGPVGERHLVLPVDRLAEQATAVAAVGIEVDLELVAGLDPQQATELGEGPGQRVLGGIGVDEDVGGGDERQAL